MIITMIMTIVMIHLAVQIAKCAVMKKLMMNINMQHPHVPHQAVLLHFKAYVSIIAKPLSNEIKRKKRSTMIRSYTSRCHAHNQCA